MRFIGILLFLSLSFNCQSSCVGDNKTKERIYSFYVVPQLALSETYFSWVSVLDHVGKELGLCFELNVPQTIPSFEQDLKIGKADFAFMNPYHLLASNRSQGYIPIIADAKDNLSGIIVIKKNSAISKIQDLNGQRIAFPAPNALAASLLIRAHLANYNIQIFPEYVKSHSNVYRSVINGDVSAGGGIHKTFMLESKQLQSELKILFETPQYMPHPIAVHPRVALRTRQSFSSTLIGLSKDPKKTVNLDAIQIPNPREVNFKDYEYLKKLGLEKFAEKVGG